jgi:hypothetical protein
VALIRCLAGWSSCPTSSGRAGRRFEAVGERELYPAAVAAIATLPGAATGLTVVPEMTGPLGIPDFVALVGGQRNLAARAHLRVPPILSELDAQIIAVLHPQAPRTVEYLQAQIQMRQDLLRSRLSSLRRSGAVAETFTGAWVRDPGFTPGGSLYAVEAKVRDFPRALKQARRYRTWAMNYVLVLGPLGPRAAQQATEEVTADGGGLVIDGKWVRKPIVRRQTTLQRIHAFEYLHAALTTPPALGTA